jgi:hypothetical protein
MCWTPPRRCRRLFAPGRPGRPRPRRTGRGHAGRRRGQPLDAGRGVVKALHPFCKLGGRTAPSWKRTWPRAGAFRPGWRAIAAHLHHQLPDPRADRGIPAPAKTTAIPGRCFVARANHRLAHDPHGARPALSLGGNAAADTG